MIYPSFNFYRVNCFSNNIYGDFTGQCKISSIREGSFNGQ